MHYDTNKKYIQVENSKYQQHRVGSPLKTYYVLSLLIFFIPCCVGTTLCTPCPENCTCEVLHNTIKLEDSCTVRCKLRSKAPERDELPPGKYITSLYLDNNKLQSLPKDAFIYLPSLSTISLDKNPWKCDCHLLWLKTWLRQNSNKLHNLNEIICATPRKLSGKSVILVNDVDFVCRKKKDRINTNKDENKKSTIRRRYKRSSCHSKLLKNARLVGHCNPDDFGSCYTDPVTSTTVAVEFKHDEVASTDTECAKVCIETHNEEYYLLYTSNGQTICFCGEQHQSCTECDVPTQSQWSEGKEICSNTLEFLRGVQKGHQTSIGNIQPYSTNSSANISINSISTIGAYFNFGDGAETIYSASGRIKHQFIIPGNYTQSFTWNDSGNVTKSVPVEVLDEPGNSEYLNSLVPVNSDVAIVLQQGTDVQIQWERIFQGQKQLGLFCEDGWQTFRDKCLKQRNDTIATYSDARKHCSEDGSSVLITFSNRAEMLEFRGVFSIKNEYFIGAQKSSSDIYKWTDTGETAFFSVSDVNDGIAEECVTTDGTNLYGRGCTVGKNFICQKDPVECPFGGIYWFQQCYVRVDSATVTWNDAASICDSEYNSGKLAIISSDDVQNFIKILAGNSTSDLWIGLSDDFSEGYYMWQDGNSLNSFGYSNWLSGQPDDTGGTQNCVVISAANSWQWRDVGCTESNGYICQYNSGETVSVPKAYAGKILSITDQTITDLPAIDATTAITNTKLFLFTGWWFSQNGILQSWIFEGNDQKTDTEIRLQVYRPHGIQNAPFRVIYAGCGDSSVSKVQFSFGTSQGSCHKSDISCPVGYQYCPLNQQCEHVATPCTCTQFPSLHVCKNTPTYTSMPNFELVAQTVVNFPHSSSGVFKISLNNVISVEQGDIIGIQIPNSSNLPIVCGAKVGIEQLWEQTYFSFELNSWNEVEQKYTFQHATRDTGKVCNAMAIYTQPVVLQPPQNLVHHALSNFETDTFHVNLSNSVQSKIILAKIYGSELDNFMMLYPCKITNNSLCVIEEGVDITFVFGGVSKETDLMFNTSIDSTFTTSFISECPSHLTDFTCNSLEQNQKYALWTFFTEVPQHEKKVQVFAYKGGLLHSLNFSLSTQERITNFTIKLTKTIAYVGENVTLTAEILNGTSVKYAWNISEIHFLSTELSVNLSFSQKGKYIIQASAYNNISTLTVLKTIFVVTGSGYISDLNLELPQLTAVGAFVNISTSALLYPYTNVHYRWTNQSGNEIQKLSARNLVDINKVISLNIEYAFSTSGNNDLFVDVLNSENNNILKQTKQVITVLNTISSVETTTNGTNGTFIPGDHMLLSVDYKPKIDIGIVYFSYDFGDQTEIKTAQSNSIVSHAFNNSGVYNVTVTVSNNVSFAVTTFTVEIMEVLNNLIIKVRSYTFIDQTTTVTAIVEGGSDVLYVLNDGFSTGLIEQEDNVFEIVYSVAGQYKIQVTAKNDISSIQVVRKIRVYELNYFKFDKITSDPYVPLNEAVKFRSSIIYYDPYLLEYEWHISDGTTYTSIPNISHSFSTIGSYTVNLTVSTVTTATYQINTTTVSTEVIVMEELENVNLTSNSSKLTLYKGSSISVLVMVSFTKGSNYSITWISEGLNVTGTDKNQTITFSTAGAFLVYATVCNKLNCFEDNITLNVYEVIEGLQLFFEQENASSGFNYTSLTSFILEFNVTAGSNIVYELKCSLEGVLVVQQYINKYNTSAGFTAGNYYTTIIASNPVSTQILTLNISIQDVIVGLQLSANPDKDYYMTGDNISFDASVKNGTNMQYIWNMFLPNGTSVTKYDTVKSFLFSLQQRGQYNISLHLKNDVSSISEKIDFVVKQLVDGNLTVNVPTFPYIPSKQNVQFKAAFLEIQHPKHFWQIRGTPFSSSVNATTTELEYVFDVSGTFSISLNASLEYLIGYLIENIYIENVIDILQVTFLNVIDNKINVNSTLSVIMQISNDTNAVYSVSFGNGDIYSISDNQLQYEYFQSGQYEINVTVSNNVSSISKLFVVTVLDKISGLYLLNCCDLPIQAGLHNMFFAHVMKGTYVYFNWTVYENQPKELVGQNITLTFSDPGNYTLSVTASNNYSQDTIWETITVIDMLTEVDLHSEPESLINLFYYEANGYNITFIAIVTGGNNSDILYTFYVKDELIGRYEIAQVGKNNTFTKEYPSGLYNVRVTARNLLGSVTDETLSFRVQELRCVPPTHELSGTNKRNEIKSQSFKIEVQVDSCIIYTTLHKWKVYVNNSAGHCDGTEVHLPITVSVTSPTITIPALTLDYGIYCFRFVSQYYRTGYKATTDIQVNILSSPLRAIITGGSLRSLPQKDNIVLSGTQSYDPDLEGSSSEGLQYNWTCSSKEASIINSCNIDNCFPPSIDDEITLPEDTWCINRIYTVELVVSKPGRNSSSAIQRIRVINKGVAVSIDCSSCRDLNIFTVSKSQHVKLVGSCSACGLGAKYEWHVTTKDGDGTITLDDKTTTTGADRPNLSIREGVLRDDKTYIFSLNVTSRNSETGSSAIELEPSKVPSNGSCEVDKTTVVSVNETITVECDKWIDNSKTLTQLIYHVYIEILGSDNNTLEWYPIYRGTNKVTSFTLASEKLRDTVKLTVDVIDGREAKTTALKIDIEVLAPIPEGNISRSAYLFLITQQNLKNLKHRNNPKALLQFVLPLTLQLNAESSLPNISAEDFTMRVSTRKEVLLVLNDSITVSAIDDVQQLAYVLSLITTYTEEFPLDINSYKSVLHIIGLMIAKLNDTVSPGMTGEEFMPGHLMEVCSNLIQIILYDIRKGSSSLEYQQLMMDAMRNIDETILLKLRTQLVDENPSKFTNNLMTAIAQRVMAEQIQQTFDDGNNTVIFPLGMLDHYIGEEVFQILISYADSVIFWGSSSKDMKVGSYICNIYMTNTSGNSLILQDLNKPVIIELAQLQMTENTKTRKKRQADNQNTEGDGHTTQEFLSHTTKSTLVNITENVVKGSTLFIKISGYVEESGNAAQLPQIVAYLGQGGVPTLSQYIQKIDVTLGFGQAGEEYLFNISAKFPSSNPDDQYYISMTNNNTEKATVQLKYFITACEYYNETTSLWDTTGCTATKESHMNKSVCECTHLTLFGSSVLLPSNPFEFKDVLAVANVSPLIYIMVCVITALYVIVAVLNKRLDIADRHTSQVVPLCGKDGLFRYEVTVVTGRRRNAGTSANVGLKVCGTNCKTNAIHLKKANAFQRNCIDTLLFATEKDIGDINHIMIWHDNTGLDTSWYLSRLIIRDLQTEEKTYFLVNDWLSVSGVKGEIEKKVKAADKSTMTKYNTMFIEELSKAAVESHCWISTFEKPARASFTRVQRLSCCVTLIYLFMFANAIWYNTNDNGNQTDGISEQDVIIGIVTACTAFVIALLVSQLFRHSAVCKDTDERARKISTAETIEMDNWIDTESEYSPAQSGIRRNPPGILRIPSDLSKDSSDNGITAKSGILKRTQNIHRVAPLCESQIPTAAVANKRKLWTHENIFNWSGNMPHKHTESDSRKSSAVLSTKSTSNSRDTSGSYHHGRKPKGILEMAEDLKCDIDEFDESLNRSNSRQQQHNLSQPSTSSVSYPVRSNEPSFISESFHPRRNLSIVDLSMGSLCNFDSSTYSRETTMLSTTVGERSRKISYAESSSNMPLNYIAEGENCQTGATALTPGYVPAHTILDDENHGDHKTEYVNYLVLPPPSRRHCYIPHRCIYLAYAINLMISLFSIGMVFYLGYNFSNTVVLKWLLACFISFLTSFFIIEPIRMLLLALIMAKVSGNLEHCEYEFLIPPMIESNETIKETRLRPIGGFALIHAKEEGKKIQRIKKILWQFIAYTFFLLVILIINFAGYKSMEFYSTTHVKDTYNGQQFQSENNTYYFKDIRSFHQYWDWLEQVMSSGLHNAELEEEAVHGYNLGIGRLRQIRSLPSDKCLAEKALKDMNAEYILSDVCYGNPSWTEDVNNYSVEWEVPSENNSAWYYTRENDIVYEGQMGSYGGGGYIEVLGSTYNETVTIVQLLRLQNWLDRATRAVFFELTEYNIGTPIFTTTTMVVEFPVSGSTIPSYKIDSFEILSFIGGAALYIGCIVILLLICVYFLIVTILSIKDQKSKYFGEFWNCMEICLTMLGFTSVVIYGYIVKYSTATFNNYLTHKAEYTSFTSVAYWINTWKYVNAALIFLLCIVVVRQLRFFKFMSKYTKIVDLAKWKFLGMGFFYIAWLCFYAQLGYLWFGHLFYSLRNVGIGMIGMLSVFRGQVKFIDEMWIQNSAFTFFFIVTFIALMFIFIFAVTLAVLQDSYKTIKLQMFYHSTLESQDYEIVDFMIERFKKWIGVKKEKPAFPKVRFQGLPSASSRVSSAKTTFSHSIDSSSGSSDMFNIIDEEELVGRVGETWNNMVQKLDQIMEIDNTETYLTHQIESQIDKQLGYMQPGRKNIPKQPVKNIKKSSLTIPHKGRRNAQVLSPFIKLNNPGNSSKVVPLVKQPEEIPVLVYPSLMKRKQIADNHDETSFTVNRPRSNSQESIVQYENEFERKEISQKRSRSETRLRRGSKVHAVKNDEEYDIVSLELNDILNV